MAWRSIAYGAFDAGSSAPEEARASTVVVEIVASGRQRLPELELGIPLAAGQERAQQFVDSLARPPHLLLDLESLLERRLLIGERLLANPLEHLAHAIRARIELEDEELADLGGDGQHAIVELPADLVHLRGRTLLHKPWSALPEVVASSRMWPRNGNVMSATSRPNHRGEGATGANEPSGARRKAAMSMAGSSFVRGRHSWGVIRCVACILWADSDQLASIACARSANAVSTSRPVFALVLRIRQPFVFSRASASSSISQRSRDPPC